MARQGKTRPARRESAANDSLLIRSAESLGRMIGSLQRQLDAARHLTDRADSEQFRGNGHVPARQSGGTAKTQRKTKSGGTSKTAGTLSAADRKSKRAAKSAATKTGAHNRSSAKQRAAKARRVR
jgi:hypothetical protein